MVLILSNKDSNQS